MAQLDAETMEMISEFFFEQHFDVIEMRPAFGSNLATKLQQVMNSFHDFRSKGLRLHYWP